MTLQDFMAALTTTRRRQRLALLVGLAPFYLAFALGWMTRTPFALFLGAIGMAAVGGFYWRHAPSFASRTAPNDNQAIEGGDEE